MQWEGSVAVVTGASRGIGRAVANALGRRGVRLGLIARSGGDLDRVLGESGGRGLAVVADVGDRSAVETAIRRIVDEVGDVDVLVNNAGIGAYGPFVETDPEVFEHLMRVNYLGTVYPTHAVLPAMLRRGRGHVVNVSSVAGRFGSPFEAAYAATKFAVAGMTEALAIELHGSGVHASLVNPGLVDTDFFEARGHPHGHERMTVLAPERVAETVLRAVERDRAEAFVPRWMRAAYVFKNLVPPAYRAGTTRTFAKEIAERRATWKSGG